MKRGVRSLILVAVLAVRALEHRFKTVKKCTVISKELGTKLINYSGLRGFCYPFAVY